MPHANLSDSFIFARIDQLSRRLVLYMAGLYASGDQILYLFVFLGTQALWENSGYESDLIYEWIYSSSSTFLSTPTRARPQTEAQLSASWTARADGHQSSSGFVNAEQDSSKTGVADSNDSLIDPGMLEWRSTSEEAMSS
jgi:hypothetical protein